MRIWFWTALPIGGAALAGVLAASAAPTVNAPTAPAPTPAPAPIPAPSVLSRSLLLRTPSWLPADAKKRPTSTPGAVLTKTVSVANVDPTEPLTEVPKRDAAGCKVSGTFKLKWPISGASGKDHANSNYLDLDPAKDAIADFKGTKGSDAITYDGHRGYDICVASFRDMVANRILALAAAPGVVVTVKDGNDDWNQLESIAGCTRPVNMVEIKHANGFVTRYLHLKKDSIKVKVGDAISAGAPVGVIGSSGCSTSPHLHFEVLDCNNDAIEPAKAGLWESPPQAREITEIMDYVVGAGGNGLSRKQIFWGPTNTTTVKPDSIINFGLMIACKIGDRFTMGMMKYSAGGIPTWVHVGEGECGSRYQIHTPSVSYRVASVGKAVFMAWLGDELKVVHEVTIAN